MGCTRDRIIAAAMAGVRQYGLEGVTIHDISVLAGLSQGAMYRYFKSKEELMEECFFSIDRQAARLFDHISLDVEDLRARPMEAVKKLWLPYFRFWTSRPDETVFYHRFRDSAAFPEFDQRRDVSYFASFVQAVRAFRAAFPSLAELDQNLLWLHVLTATVMYAKYVVEGVLPANEATENAVFQLMTSGLAGFLAPPAEPER